MPTKVASGKTWAMAAMWTVWKGVFSPHRCLPWPAAWRWNMPL